MIVDASVFLKWRLEERDSSVATALLTRTDLAAPALIVIEIAHVLTKRVRQRALTAVEAAEIWADLRSAPVRLVDDEPLVQGAFDLSLRLAASFYDCLYLMLAATTGDILVTADERFAATVRREPSLASRVLTLAETVSP